MSAAAEALQGEEKRQATIIRKLKEQKHALQVQIDAIDLKIAAAKAAGDDVAAAMKRIKAEVR